jgi:hypothetical protein
MEPTMISLKVLGTAAVMAMVLPMLAPTASFAENPHGGKGAAPGGVHAGSGAAPRFGGGAPRTFNGGGGFRPGSGPAVAQQFGANGGNWRGSTGREGWRDGHRGDGRERNGRGFVPGVIAGAVIGGALASQSYGYYGDRAYYAPGYYDDQYDDGAVAGAPAAGGDEAVAYCIQNYSSYDPASGTYLGNDGYRHLCP